MGGSADDADLALLRAHEPVVVHTRGELFLPTAVDPYVARCSLWAGEQEGAATCVATAGALTLERLCETAAAHRGRSLSLRFVQEPLGRAAYRRWRQTRRERVAASARFTTTGMLGRLVDAGFRATLLLRGKVPAGIAAAAEVAYRRHLEADRCTYYGRVVREGGYACLQYWLFYAMNDWRSTFGGVNDHEADWELVVVYLADDGRAPPQPAWVACSSHDHRGSELRRRWDDPELRRDGDHPIVFAGAGSHAGSFVPGDYVVMVDPPQLRTLLRLARRTQRLLAPWRDETHPGGGFGVPFVDYKRGDGQAVGPGRDISWTPVLIDDETPWVRDFRGLWGLDTEDPFGGERAPAGPRYERDGSVRTAWASPPAWAGLLDVPPHDDAAGALRARIAELDGRLPELDARIAAEREALRGLRAQALSLDAHDHARPIARARRAELTQREAALRQTIADRARLAEERTAHIDTLRNPTPPEPPRAHLTAPLAARVEEQERRRRFLRAWGVISTPLLLALVIVALNARPLTWIATLGVLVVAFAGVEAIARRRFLSFVASLLLLAATLGLTAGTAVLVRGHWRIVLSVLLGAAAVALLVGNLRDARHRWRRVGERN